jgi:hypothetical protein
MMRKERDFLADLERLDAIFDGKEPGDIPLDILAARGIDLPDEATLTDAEVHRRLWQVIGAMAALGLFLSGTDHLSDRQLYRYLGDALQRETMISDDLDSAWHLSPIGGGSEEDTDIYLRYHADDEDREWWAAEGVEVPPKETAPFDRDRLLPQRRTLSRPSMAAPVAKQHAFDC